MANLNLSEFTEKLFVADADHTFIWDSAASISKRVSRNSWLNSGTLTSDAPVTISQTWNAGTNVMTALKVVATDTASGATSNLLELWSGATPALKLGIKKGGSIISKVGVITPSGTANASGLSLELFFSGCGLGIDNNGSTQFFIDGTAKTRCGLGVVVASDQAIAWSSTTHTGLAVASDTILLRDGAPNTLALRNGTSAQTFNVYGTYTSITDYKRLSLSCSATTGNATIGVPFNSVLAVTGGSSPSTTATITFATQAAAFPVGSSVVVAGVTPSGYNGTYVVTASTTSSVSYTVGGALAAWSSGGTATISGSNVLNLTGNVGIGTTAPTSNLTVAGTFNFGSNNGALIGGTSYGGHLGSTQYFGLRSTSAVSTTIYLQNNSSGDKNAVIRILGSGSGADHGALDINTIESSPILFTTGLSNERMRITAAGNVGIGTTSPTSKLHVAETWNAAGTTFAAAKIVVTDTASAAASNLLELWSGSTPALKSYVTKSGSFVGGVVGANQPSALSFPNSGSYSVGIYNPASYKIQFSMSSADPGGVAAGAYTGLQYEMTAGVLSWGTTAQDIVLLRDGEADHLALRRGALGQKFSVYGTYPGANWERFTITAPTSGNVLLGTYKGTGGIARGLEFQTDGVTRMSINSTGAVTFDSNVNINSSLRITFINNQTSALSMFVFSSDATGASTYALGGSAPLMRFGGTTDSFPAIARDNAGIKFTGGAAGSTAWVKVPPVAVTALPDATVAGVGARAFVNDALAPTFGSAVTGGGSVPVPVYSTGSAWNVG